ncbi:hypothetical protein, partial [Corallococcus sp. CA031C]|uniref:hypothetical protein n=1 Tax=Corallococcus sp. CA031C TaxID=2316725 RepID=UPI00351A8C95
GGPSPSTNPLSVQPRCGVPLRAEGESMASPEGKPRGGDTHGEVEGYFGVRSVWGSPGPDPAPAVSPHPTHQVPTEGNPVAATDTP